MRFSLITINREPHRRSCGCWVLIWLAMAVLGLLLLGVAALGGAIR